MYLRCSLPGRALYPTIVLRSPSRTKRRDRILNTPCLSGMNQILAVVYKGRLSASQLRSHTPSLCKTPSQVALSAGWYLPWLASQLPYDIAIASSVRDCDSVTASDICNQSHLVFRENFWKRAFMLSEGVAESFSGPLAVCAIPLCPKTHFILVLTGPDSNYCLALST